MWCSSLYQLSYVAALSAVNVYITVSLNDDFSISARAVAGYAMKVRLNRKYFVHPNNANMGWRPMNMAMVLLLLNFKHLALAD